MALEIRRINCLKCNLLFPPFRGQRYCSEACGYKTGYVRVSDRSYKLFTRTGSCLSCGNGFEYQSAGINSQKYCSDFCRGKARHIKSKSKPLCVFEGCKNPRYYSSGLCNSCYYRIKRSGTVDKRVWKYRSVGSNGYVRLSTRDHPLSKSGYVYEHRKVLYDAIGQGPHKCHWCKTPVHWIIGKCLKGSLVPDHLDGDRDNNAVSNLVPACNSCNATRGLFQSWVSRHQDDPWLWRMYETFKTNRDGRNLSGVPGGGLRS